MQCAELGRVRIDQGVPDCCASFPIVRGEGADQDVRVDEIGLVVCCILSDEKCCAEGFCDQETGYIHLTVPGRGTRLGCYLFLRPFAIESSNNPLRVE